MRFTYPPYSLRPYHNFVAVGLLFHSNALIGQKIIIEGS